jgi:putative ABC transport system permease protein
MPDVRAPFFTRFASLLDRTLGVFRSQRIEKELRDEMQAHIDMRTELLIAQGCPPDKARRQAMRQFGNRTHMEETARAQHVLPPLESVMQDLRYGLRLIGRNPGFTAITILVLGLGTGLNAAMFSVFEHVLLAPLPLPDPGRLYVVSSHAHSLGDARRAASGPDFRDYRDQGTSFSGVAALIPRFSMVWTGDREPRVVNCAAITMQFFNVTGIQPAMGRVYVPGEFGDLQNETAIVSWSFWKNQLGGDPNVIGRTLRLEDFPSTIVGVLPPMPDLYSDVDVWLKLTTEPAWPYMGWRANKFLDVIGRLRPGVDPRAAEQEMTAILRRAPDEPRNVEAQLTPLRDFIVGPVRRQLEIIMAAVALVLLITLFNTAAIFFARSIKRRPEFAMRLGLGASRARLRRQLLVEGALVSTAGCAFGVVLGVLGVTAMRQFPAIGVPRIGDAHLSGGALAVSLGVVLVSSVAFAVLPGSMLKLDVPSAFRGGRTETGRAQRPFALLIVGEVACAVVLTVCAGLLVRSFMHLRAVDLGYQPDRVVTAYLRTNYTSPEGFPFWSNVLRATGALPGATSSAISDCLPSVRANAATIVFDDRPNVRGREPSTEACWISPDYFRTLGTAIVHGRLFTDHDDADAPPVAIINAEAARRLFPNVDPVGRRIGVNYLALGSRTIDSVPRMRRIVAVISDMRQVALNLPPGPAIYLPYTQDETHHVLNSMNVYVRSAGSDPTPLGRGLRSTIQAMYANQPVERIRVMPQVIASSIARRTYAMVLLIAFASLALLLSALGIYGVVSYVTQQRTREFAIRMALGAQRGDVLADVLKGGGRLVGMGMALGAGLSLFVAAALSQLLFETGTADPVVYGSAIALLGLTGTVACLAPAIRATRLDPRVALNT